MWWHRLSSVPPTSSRRDPLPHLLPLLSPLLLPPSAMQEPSIHDRALSPPLNVIGDLHHLHHPPPLKLAGGAKKRKKLDDGAPSAILHNSAEPEPRRLRRLHEACARCRRKKIKCDSMLPNCGACQGAGVECTQEDRHRQTLKPRGYTDQLEAQVDKCTLLLQKFIPGFKLEFLDYHLHQYGVPLPSSLPGQPLPPPSSDYSLPPYPHRTTPPDDASPSATTTSVQHAPPYPTLDQQPPAAPTSSRTSIDATSASPGSLAQSRDKKPIILQQQKNPSVDPTSSDDKGRDPHGNDMSGFAGLVRGFGVGKVYAKGVKPGTYGSHRPCSFLDLRFPAPAHV